MNLEGLTLKLVTDTLSRELLNSKIYKVFMPNPHALLLLVRRTRDTNALLADMNGGSPALYIPEQLPENPETPPTFCMLLRKHLEEGRITRITQSGLDRIITLEIDMLGASSKIITKKLIFELTGKNSNIILTQDDIIIDSLKHVGAAQSSYRAIQPGKPYVAPPPQSGLNLLTASPADIVQAANAVPAASFLKAFIGATTGIGKSTAQELLQAADIVPQEVRLDNASCAALADVIAKLQSRLNAAEQEQPVYALISRTNQVKTILTLPPQLLEQGMHAREFANINSAINFAMSLKPIQLPQHEQLQKLVTGEIAKHKKKLAALEQDLAHAENAEEQRMLADTIMANIYQLRKGQTQAELINIYDGESVTVQLSPILSPTENAQAYYKRYNKYKRAQSEVALQITATEEMLQYLASLDSSLLTATSKSEIEEIRQEMIAADLIKVVGKKKKSALQKSQPLHIRLSEDTDLYIGKNNRQNDYVTFSIGGPRDLWFHTKDIPGSHIILKTTLPEAREEDIALAVELAAYFSKAREGSSVPVDCVQRRYVKKPSGSKPGFVIFTNQKTYYATPDAQKLEKYLK
ncbi:Rqc2 family fibronectin-binding protein [Phascolarctobacterium sp.]|uniref:Rqc2 family fibronectin-binding protein n=1 Tax=Phascolarctobacterium sp. TaxID=2049039 RepID=UPI003F7FAA6A